MKIPFKEVLMKIASSTNSTLIITDGTMKSVGEAIVELNINTEKVCLLGITNWGKVYGIDVLEVFNNYAAIHFFKS